MKTRLVTVMAIAMAVTLAGARGAAAQSAPGTAAANGPCRTVATADTMTFTSTVGVSGSVSRTCDYNKDVNEHTCNVTYRDTRGTPYTSVITMRYASTADFVGDAPRVVIFASAEYHPDLILTRQTAAGGGFAGSLPGVPGFSSTTSGIPLIGGRGLTTTNSAATAGASATTVAYDYDGRRLIRLSTRNPRGTSEQLFSAWDTFGRPTASLHAGQAFTYSYDDAARTARITNVTGGQVITMMFDEAD
jgi:YD repeat-containing protein